MGDICILRDTESQKFFLEALWWSRPDSKEKEEPRPGFIYSIFTSLSMPGYLHRGPVCNPVLHACL